MIHQRKTQVVDNSVPNKSVNHQFIGNHVDVIDSEVARALRPNMRMQLTRPRGRWSKAGRSSNASLQLIRGR